MILFFGLAYAWSWIVFTAMVVFHAAPQWTILGTLGPTVAALVAHRVTAGNFRAFRLVSTWGRTLLATGDSRCLGSRRGSGLFSGRCCWR